MAGVRQHGWRAIPAVCSEYGADTLPDRYRSDGRCLLFRQQAGISALKQELEVKTPYRAMNHPVIGVVTKADLASMEQISLVKSWLREAGAHNVLVTSAVNNNGVTELLPCCIQKKAVVNFDWFSDENDDGDTQIRINEQ